MADKTEIYQRVWKEWASTNPAAIENDDPEWWAAVRAAVDGVEIAKHPGPGGSVKHATGSDQSAHGKGGGDSEAVVDQSLEEKLAELKAELTANNAAYFKAVNSAVGSGGFPLDLSKVPGLAELESRQKEIRGEMERLRGQERSSHYSEDVKLPTEWIMTAYEADDPLTVIPETLPGWSEPAPNHDILNTIDSKMFSGTDGHNPNWNRRTSDGLRSVAKTMDENFGAEIQESFDRFHDEYHPQVETFADQQWEKYTGIASEGGYDAEGNETWRKYMKPRWIEGQGTIGIHNDEFIHDSRDFRGQDDSLDPGNAWHIRDFVTNTRFVQALEAEGIDVLNIKPNSRPVDRGDLTWEREIARADIRSQVIEDLRWFEDDLGYAITSSKDNTNMVDIAQEWASPLWAASWDSPSHKITQDLRSRWANSSTDPLSIGVHHAVNDLFPTSPDTTHFSAAANAEGLKLYRTFPEVFKGYASSVYAHTQAGFKKMGVTHVPLVRGMGAILGDDFTLDESDSLGDWEQGFDLFDFPLNGPTDFGSTTQQYQGFSVTKTHKEGNVFVFNKAGEHELTLNPHPDGYKIAWVRSFDYGSSGGEVLTSSEDLISYLRSDHPTLLYANSDWTEAKVDMQPISSFSTKTDTSRAFAPVYDTHDRGMTHSILLRATVPVEWIWGHASDGFGSLKEHEVLVLGDQGLPFDVISVPVGEPLPGELIYKILEWQS